MDILKEQLQENVLSFLDGHSEEILDGLCQLIIDTIDQVKEPKASKSGLEINSVSKEEFNRIAMENSRRDREIFGL
jgi:hypothetical protein